MAGFYSVYMQVHFISVYTCKIVFSTGKRWLARKAWPFPGSHDVAYTARLQLVSLCIMRPRNSMLFVNRIIEKAINIYWTKETLFGPEFMLNQIVHRNLNFFRFISVNHQLLIITSIINSCFNACIWENTNA